jgi:hypothetical protein
MIEVRSINGAIQPRGGSPVLEIYSIAGMVENQSYGSVEQVYLDIVFDGSASQDKMHVHNS